MADFEKIGGRAKVHQADAFDHLTRSERGTLFDWLRGDDVRALLPKSSFYRVRSSIQKKNGLRYRSPPGWNGD
ncbi:hypothetical protein D3C78_1615970 [compost metagenome]